MKVRSLIKLPWIIDRINLIHKTPRQTLVSKQKRIGCPRGIFSSSFNYDYWKNKFYLIKVHWKENNSLIRAILILISNWFNKTFFLNNVTINGNIYNINTSVFRVNFFRTFWHSHIRGAVQKFRDSADNQKVYIL